MNRYRLFIPILLLCLTSCSPENDDDKTNTIRQTAQEKGHEAARQIKTPLEKAELSAKIQEDRNQKVDEMVEQQ